MDGFPGRVWSALVLTLILLMLLLWFGLVVFLGAWTLWFQAYIYNDPVERIWWRAPAAGSALAVFFLFWVWLDYGTDGRFRGLFEFSAREEQAPYKELIIETNDGEKTYTLKKEAGHWTYRRDGKEIPTRPKKVIVVENDVRSVFEPETDDKGKFKAAPNQPLRYVHKASGRSLTEGQWAQLSTFRWWWFIQNLFVNFLHFAVWLVCLWLLLKFQFWHAFGMAVVAWLAMTVFILPPLLDRAEETAKERSQAALQTGPQLDARMCMMSPSCTMYVLPSRR
jgi:hypothetical protein